MSNQRMMDQITAEAGEEIPNCFPQLENPELFRILRGEPNHSMTPTAHGQHEHIELSDGSLFYPATQTEFTIHTIAHSGALACRFGGQCREFYSVAQHGVLVSHVMEYLEANPLEGLLHDASESFMLDMPSPIKRMLPDYKKLELSLLDRIRAAFGLPPGKSLLCEKADKIALFLEAYDLLPSQGTSMDDPAGLRDMAFDLRPKFAQLLIPLDWRAAKYQFLKRYKELTK